MINTDRIVPVTKTDLITLYGVILKTISANSTMVALDASGPSGAFQVTSGTKPLLASEPVTVCDIDATDSSVTAATVYFVPAPNYEGFTIDGSAVTTLGATVEADGNTLYKATLATGAITIAQVGV